MATKDELEKTIRGLLRDIKKRDVQAEVANEEIAGLKERDGRTDALLNAANDVIGELKAAAERTEEDPGDAPGELQDVKAELVRLKAVLAARSITPAGAPPADGPNKPVWNEGPTEILAPASMIGASIAGQEIGKDRKVTVAGRKAFELCRAHGFEMVE